MIKYIVTLVAAAICSISISAARIRPYFDKAIQSTDSVVSITATPNATSTLIASLIIPQETPDTAPTIMARHVGRMPMGKYGPVVFDSFTFDDTVKLFSPDTRRTTDFPKVFDWLDDYDNSQSILREMRHDFMFAHPTLVRYNAASLPEVPKQFRAYVDNVTTRIVFEELKVNDKENALETTIAPKRWIHSFDGSLQFSQAYISPNWYQGGNNNLNMIGQLIYNVKLNQKFHPNLLFETTVAYKLALNSAPDDSIHAVNISEDIFQVNSTFGLKAAKNWYYSANLLFKTQLLNSYPTNSYDMKAAFLSPGELNLGLGMTYSTSNKKKTLTFGASISPVSWNLKSCTNHRIDPETYGIDNGHRIKNKVGSSAECTLEWKLAYNIMYRSRLFLFTDYEYGYGDWEHTVDFNINRFLSTRLYVHMRYDSSTPQCDNPNWHKFQIKEIFSFGFSYHFGTV